MKLTKRKHINFLSFADEVIYSRMKYATLYLCLTYLCILSFTNISHAQPGSSVDLADKPARYENRRLASEKTGETKFSGPKRVYQNMITHYNYYFNANNKLNDIVDRAKAGFKDDYTQLLPFYNYTLETTSTEKTQLDSVIYKCTAGILLHDLRNDWIDNLYLLLGKAYFLRNNLDTSLNVFRYINYAFAPKDDGYDIPIGSNASGNEGIFTVVTKEDRNFWKKMTTHLPSRNEALLWLVRNYTELKKYPEASGLIEILRHDPNFPKHLTTKLDEYVAYWFYSKSQYDSAAAYLVKALPNAVTMDERARWEYLIAQMYQAANNGDQASVYFNRSANHTINPVMGVYATLNSIQAGSEATKELLEKKQNSLLKLAKREKFYLNRDIIYYAVARLSQRMGQTAEAQKYLHKSIATSVGDPRPKSLSFLLLGDINYDSREYVAAYGYYDSVDIKQLTNEADKMRLAQRRGALKTIATNIGTIKVQDSLQRLASLPANERDEAVRKKLRELRRLAGQKEEPNVVNPALLLAANANAAPDMFAAPDNSGDSYFNNIGLKSSGYGDFRQKWGNRPNVDNWRRSASIDQSAKAQAKENEMGIAKSDKKDADTSSSLTFDALLSKLPLTPDKMQVSNDKVEKALLSNGVTFQNQLSDLPLAIETYRKLLERYPNSKLREEVLSDLYYSYRRNNQYPQADSIKALLNRDYANGKWTQLILHPVAAEKSEANPATQRYKQVYDLFISGEFDKAKEEKKKADSVYGKTYWSPQLLYIESVYYIKQHDDSTAINRLSELSKLYAASPLAEKANTMIDVLRRRKEIETYLTNLQVTRNVDDNAYYVDQDALKVTNTVKTITKDSVVKNVVTPVITLPVKRDTVPVIAVKQFRFIPDSAHYVVLLLDKVDPVYVSEARNAFNRYNREKFYAQKIDIGIQKLDDRYNLMLVGPFPRAFEAMDYIDKTKPITGTRIIPWLTGEKYSYMIISGANLSLLQENKDLESYKKMLKQALPDKF